MPSSFQPHSDDLAMRSSVRQAVARAGENGLADELTTAQAQLTLDQLNTLAAETLSAWQKTSDSPPTPASIALLRESRTATVEAFRLALALSRSQKNAPVPTRSG